MATRPNIILLASSGVYFIAGIGALFVPGELLEMGGAESTDAAEPLVQILGAAVLGFATMNWYSRNTIIGGILGRLIVAPNFTFTFIATAVLARTLIPEGGSALAWVGLATYAMLALLFGIKMFGPTPTSDQGLS